MEKREERLDEEKIWSVMFWIGECFLRDELLFVSLEGEVG